MTVVQSIRKLAPSLADGDLVLAARTGEGWAREALFRRHADAVYAVAFRLLGPHGGAREVLHDVFVKGFASLHEVRDPSAFRARLLRIVVSCVRRRLNGRRWFWPSFDQRAPDFEAFEAQLAALAADRSSDVMKLYQLVEQLSAPQRLAYLLRYIEGFETEAIADALDTSASHVRRLLSKAQRRIAPPRKRLAE